MLVFPVPWSPRNTHLYLLNGASCGSVVVAATPAAAKAAEGAPLIMDCPLVKGTPAALEDSDMRLAAQVCRPRAILHHACALVTDSVCKYRN